MQEASVVNTRVDLVIGQKMQDQTIFAGISPNTNRPMFATPFDESNTMKWLEAMVYASGFEGHGRSQGSFRLPTSKELKVIFTHRAEIGGFRGGVDAIDDYSSRWHWSSTQDNLSCAKMRNFQLRDLENWAFKVVTGSIRLICD